MKHSIYLLVLALACVILTYVLISSVKVYECERLTRRCAVQQCTGEELVVLRACEAGKKE